MLGINGLTHFRLNKLPPDILEEANFNFEYVKICYLAIPREKWLNYLQTVTLIRRHSVASDLDLLCLSITLVCVEVLRLSQPNGVMSGAVSLPNHTFTGQA